MSNDLPDGVADAAPATGWESAEVSDGESRERSAAESAEAALPSDDVADAATGHAVEAEDDVESAEASQRIDPDMATDADGEGSR